ncbi:aldehyde dehydrogenase (NADP(+)) [Flavobacterium sp. PL002]|uniref:aldehyde dehydrogenase (NADP(+)) n=1 Tax=Flavobacterium sp. PL002 TaxID=1897058 RepID=UPI001787F129|nr:aldehyde dehydrogenase (NADP(+)) [Flavobacterium sp. PL002]MBE0392694.1 Alpha-ketoglutaric semialdehyde dehydrogenase [Flavobacterium sp. PL002]
MISKDTFQAINPVDNTILADTFANATPKEIDEVVEKATNAFTAYRKKTNAEKAHFLEQIGIEIANLGDALINRCHLETALPIARLLGERGRTINQLNLFASYLREGSWVDARIDTAIPDRAPLPRPDIRHILIPLGPVAVFGASNFPLAFSTAGGDTASALAAGCPVIVKTHEAHPGTSQMMSNAIYKAIKTCNMPEGTFALIQGNSKKIGAALVQHSGIKAVGFTGSFAGGKALFDYANARPEPIPVFAEMGSTNPVFILPEMLKNDAAVIAAGLAQSITMGVGQFCTNPGLVFLHENIDNIPFYEELQAKFSVIAAGTMLTPNIKKMYDKGALETQETNQIEVLAKGETSTLINNATAQLFKTTSQHFNANPSLAEENFGPSSIIVEASSKEAILKHASDLQGHLTATVFGTSNDLLAYKELFDILELKVGRILINNYPTGVEVCHAMVHGGPFPATTAPNSTSVGTGAIERFVRPVCYQNYPEALLPDALKNANPLHIFRLVNGEITTAKC